MEIFDNLLIIPFSSRFSFFLQCLSDSCITYSDVEAPSNLVTFKSSDIAWCSEFGSIKSNNAAVEFEFPSCVVKDTKNSLEFCSISMSFFFCIPQESSPYLIFFKLYFGHFPGFFFLFPPLFQTQCLDVHGTSFSLLVFASNEKWSLEIWEQPSLNLKKI